MFTENDLAQIHAHGLTPQAVEKQIDNFKAGFPFLSIDRAAVAGDGIVTLSAAQAAEYGALYDAASEHLKVVKFVPASGAATRMFKELFEFIGEGKQSKNVDDLLARLEDFAFAAQLKQVCGGKEPKDIVEAVVARHGLGYGSQPKALILFHKYDDHSRTAAEEHLAEGAMYAAAGGKVNIHFTVSGEHLDGFKKLFEQVLAKYEKMYGVKYDITFSQQKSSTDTIAVTPDDEPFREADGSLLFRPAGHGALIDNLNDIDADIIFIKNIDNVAPDRLKADTIAYKKALAGMLLDLQAKAFALQKALMAGADEALLSKAAEFVEHELSFRLPAGFAGRGIPERQAYLLRVLDRPIRLCGVVQNDGEPGGGPFWVKRADGAESLQIAESSQIAPADMTLMTKATHFNPVDLVCAVKDFQGKKYDLPKYVDPETGFISSKSKDGRALKAQEVPGLWNGAMADWNTVFVEVPISTFSPVKAVTDLLRSQHQ